MPGSQKQLQDVKKVKRRRWSWPQKVKTPSTWVLLWLSRKSISHSTRYLQNIQESKYERYLCSTETECQREPHKVSPAHPQFRGEIESITITVRKVWQSLPVVVGESWRELGVCARWYPSKACLLWSTPHRCAISQRLHSPQNRATSLGTSIQTLSPREECSDSNHSK